MRGGAKWYIMGLGWPGDGEFGAGFADSDGAIIVGSGIADSANGAQERGEFFDEAFKGFVVGGLLFGLASIVSHIVGVTESFTGSGVRAVGYFAGFHGVSFVT